MAKRGRKRKSFVKSKMDLGKPTYKYLECKNGCGHEEKVDIDTKEVVCSMCTVMSIPMPEKAAEYVPTGRPAGWHFMKEFVDKDGNVFHRGKEQPKLKGTLPPTKIEKKKIKRRSKEEILREREEKKKKALKKAEKKRKKEMLAFA